MDLLSTLMNTVDGRAEGDFIDATVDGGALRGLVTEGVRTWRGVPYGVADRWKAPRPVEWEGVWQADEYGNVAPQTTYTLKDDVVGDEDCLNLDVVRPDTEETLPVVVYLHGGGFFAGASHTAVLRGFSFAKRVNAVYVAVNFRLGVFGYLDMSSLGVELSLIHISEPTRLSLVSRMPSSA